MTLREPSRREFAALGQGEMRGFHAHRRHWDAGLFQVKLLTELPIS